MVGALFWIYGALFWVGGGTWRLVGVWGNVGMGRGVWEREHYLIMPIKNFHC